MTETMLFIGGLAAGLLIGGALAWRMASQRGAHDVTVLRQSTAQLVQMADMKLRESQQGAKADLTALLSPIQTQLTQLAEHTRVLEKNREGAYQNLHTLVETLKENHKALQQETNLLSRALRSPNARGRWGEKQLRNVLEMSGMTSYSDFIEQGTLSDETTTRRPDVIVTIPGGGKIAVDSKVPLNAFQDMLAASDDAQRGAAAQRHVADVRRHVKELSGKQYWEQLPSPQFVVLFLPGEHYLHSALEQAPDLLDEALAKNVLLATPASLIALLKAVAYGWQQERLAQNAVAVRTLGQQLYKRLSTLAAHWQKVGNALQAASTAFNNSVGTLENSVLVTARKFNDMGVTDGSMDVTVNQIDVMAPRTLSAPEFAAPEAEFDAENQADAEQQEKLRKLG